MNKFALVAIAGVLSTSTAFAADLGYVNQAAPAAYTNADNWSGFYAGLNGGYGWSEYDVGGLVIEDIEGILGGAQIGYNYDFGGFVLGAEGDFQFSDISREESALGLTANVGIDSFGTVRARAGVAVDRFLPYLTGGIAWANGSASLTDGVTTVSADETYVGYAVGAGLEFAATDNVTVKGEYLYADFGDKDFGGVNTNLDAHIVRVGVNFKF